MGVYNLMGGIPPPPDDDDEPPRRPLPKKPKPLSGGGKPLPKEILDILKVKEKV